MMKNMKKVSFTILFMTLAVSQFSGRFVFGEETNREELERKYERSSRRAASRDAFPVFHNPELTPASKAEDRMRDNEWVIGVSINGDHRAYPVEVMGVHELGNDTVGGKPITVCW